MDMGLRLLGSRVGRAFTRLAGWAAEQRWPRPLLRRFIGFYAWRYGADLGESARDADEFETFLDFFTRELRPGIRPIGAAADSLVSPVDGRVSSAGFLDADRLIQAKGHRYGIGTLVGTELASPFIGGPYANLYLAPGDYHRVHAPAHLSIESLHHVPGRLYPVNDWSRRQVPDLYGTNERLVVSGRCRAGRMLVVFIAATVVGRARVVFDSLTTHNGAGVRESRQYTEPEAIAKGAELGRFELGSTIILIGEPGSVDWEGLTPGRKVRVGEQIGRLLR